MQLWMKGIEQNQTVRREKLGEEFPEGAAIRFLAAITRPKQLEQFFAAGNSKTSLDFPQQRFDSRAKLHLAYRAPLFFRRGQNQVLQLAVIKPCGVPYFVNVVIFGSHPKDRYRVDSRKR